jgi:hypothetical protein
MPKTTAKKGFPCKPEHCYANRHLKPNIYKMYQLMMGFAKAGQKSRGHEQLVCTASVRPTLCNSYPCSEANAHYLIDELCELGWVIKHESGRDAKTSHFIPNAYEMVEHVEFVKRHPDSCPPYIFAPDLETAEAYGLQSRGDRLAATEIPENFLNVLDYLSPERRVMWLALGEYYGRMTDDERAAEYERLKNLTFEPQDPVDREQRSKEHAEARKQSVLHRLPSTEVEPVSTNVETADTVTRLHKRGDDPSPQMDDTRLHKRGVTVSTNVERILKGSILEKPPQPLPNEHGGHEPQPPGGSGSGEPRKPLAQIAIDSFQRKTSEVPTLLPRSFEKKMNEFEIQFTRPVCLLAIEVFVKESPWDPVIDGVVKKTNSPLSHLVKYFVHYVQKVNDDVKREDARKDDAVNVKRSERCGVISHLSTWHGVQIEEFATADEKTRFDEIKGKKFDATDDDVAFARNLCEQVAARDKADKEKQLDLG